MNKLLGYFVKKKDASSDVDFPQLEKEEEEEIQKHLGIPENSRMNTRSLLMATLKNFSQYENDEFDCGTIGSCSWDFARFLVYELFVVMFLAFVVLSLIHLCSRFRPCLWSCALVVAFLASLPAMGTVLVR